MTTHSPSRFRGPVSPASRWRAQAFRRPAPVDTDCVRLDLVNRVRSEIAAGLYDTTDRLANALDAMYRRLDSD